MVGAGQRIPKIYVIGETVVPAGFVVTSIPSDPETSDSTVKRYCLAEGEIFWSILLLFRSPLIVDSFVRSMRESLSPWSTTLRRRNPLRNHT